VKRVLRIALLGPLYVAAAATLVAVSPIIVLVFWLADDDIPEAMRFYYSAIFDWRRLSSR